MRHIISAFFLLIFVTFSNTAIPQCLDYELTMPLVGETGCPNKLIAVDVWQSWAFAIDATSSTGRQLVVYSINDPESPQQVATYPLPLRMETITCNGGRLYLGSEYSASSLLLILDVSNPLNPQELGQLPVAGSIRDIEVEENICAVAADGQGLLLVDVSDPQFLSVAGTFVPHANAISVDIRNNKALVGFNSSSGGQLYWTDIALPGFPQTIFSLAPGGNLYDAILLGDEPRALVTHGFNRISSLDMSDPLAPTITEGPQTAGPKMTLAGNMVVCQKDYHSDVSFIDISDPQNLRWLAYLGDYAQDSALKGSFLILARNSGLAVVQLTDLDEMPVAGVLHDIYSLSRLLPTGKPEVLLASFYSGFHIVDFADPAQPQIKSTIDCNYPMTSASRDSLVYVIHRDGTLLLDIKDPANPQHLANLNLPGEEEIILIDNNLMYLGSGLDGLYVLDITDPAQPVELGTLKTPGYIRGLAFYNQLLVVGDGYSGLKIVDVGDPASPQLVGEIYEGMNAQFLVVEGSRCFAAGENFLSVVEVDLSLPENPVTVASFTLPARPTGMLLKDGHLWVTNINGTWIYNIDIPGQPVLEWTMPFPGQTKGMQPVGDVMAALSTLLFTIRPPCVPLPPVSVDLPNSPLMFSVAPNPFNPETAFHFHLNQAGRIHLTVYDVKGHRVRDIVHEEFAAGDHTLNWNGRNNSGRNMPSGVYLVQLNGPDGVFTRKIALAR